MTLAPANGEELVINTATRFSWRGADDADLYEFHVFDRQSGDIERYYRRGLQARDICRTNDADGPVCTIELAIALPYLDGHAWRVRAGNVAGWSSWSRDLFTMVPSGLLRGAPAASDDAEGTQ